MKFYSTLATVFALASASMAASIIVSPTGTNAGAGTIASPKTLTAAITSIAAGDTILMRGGTYSFNIQINLAVGNNGTATAMKNIFAYPNEKPVLDFSTQAIDTNTANNFRGIQMDGNYWHLRGLDIKNSADNGVFVSGNYNIVELCLIHGNHDSGLQISRRASTQTAIADWPSYNLILNCESFDNYDTPPLAGENADGFAAKLSCGLGNVFRGCVSHNNIDDGWDLFTKLASAGYGPIGSVTIDRCVAHHNGTLTDGTTNANGDKNGFKLGGSDMANVHYVTRCVSYANGKCGFTWNSNPGELQLSNNLAFDNTEPNFKFDAGSKVILRNNISIWTSGTGPNDKIGDNNAAGSNPSNVFWINKKSSNDNSLVFSLADFKNTISTTMSLPRLANGDLDMSVFELATGSDLLNAGVVPTGFTLPYNPATYFVGLPDIAPYETGAVEASSSSAAVSSSSATVVSSSSNAVSTLTRVRHATVAQSQVYDLLGRAMGANVAQQIRIPMK